jgi:hypothetical protein
MTTAPLAQAPGSNFGTSQQLDRLLGLVDLRRQQTKTPAAALCVEVDGSVLAPSLELSCDKPASLTLPQWARSVTLRDEGGSVRAHVLLQEQTLDRASFDRGRLLLSAHPTADGSVRFLIEQARLHIP